MFKAIKQNNIKKVEKKLKKGFMPNSLFNEYDCDKNLIILKGTIIPICFAASKGYVDIVKLLVKFGANIHASNDSWDCPLHTSTFYGHIDVVRFLLSRDINVNKRDRKGNTALHVAVMKSHFNCVHLLLTNASDIDMSVKNNESKTALDLAKREHVAHIIEFMQEKQREQEFEAAMNEKIRQIEQNQNKSKIEVPSPIEQNKQTDSLTKINAEKIRLLNLLKEAEEKEEEERKRKLDEISKLDYFIESLQ